jgi:hypothetical protein
MARAKKPTPKASMTMSSIGELLTSETDEPLATGAGIKVREERTTLRIRIS